MKNLEQSVVFPAIAVCSTPTSKELSNAMVKYSSAKTDEERAAAKDELNAQIPDPLRKELDNLGVTLPHEMIKLHLSLGSLFFDMFVHTTKAPTAPLARHLFQKRCQDLASMLEEKELHLPEYALEAARKAMNDDTVWGTLNVSAWIELPTKEKRFIPINSKGINFFGEVVQAAVLALDPPKAAPVKEQPKLEAVTSEPAKEATEEKV